MFKKHKAYEISDSYNVSKKKVKEDLTNPVVDMGDTFDTNIENVDVMEEWVERRLIIKAEHKIMNRKYLKGRMWKDLGWILLASLIVTIGFDYFVSSTGSTGLFPFGFGAFARFFAIITWKDNPTLQSSFYYIYYFAINVPLIIFGFYKIGVKFSFLTMFAMVAQIAIDQIITRIPVVGPQDFNPLINNKLMGLIPAGAWNNTIWLFIKAFIGGMLLGVGYGMPYIVGGSNGGADFPSMYISIRYKKNISKVNKVVYFLTFFTAIVLNTVILSPENFNPDIKFGELYNTAQGANVDNTQLWDSIQNYVGVKNSTDAAQLYFDPNIISKFQGAWAEKAKWQQSLNELAWGRNASDITQYEYREFMLELAQSKFSGFTTSMISEMRFLFIFGPSLFASLLMIYMSTTVMNKIYPTHTIKTYVISTDKTEELKNALNNLGYRNNIVEWTANTEARGKELNKDIMMVTMSVSNWKEIRDDLLEVDPKMNVNILKTDKVRGKFDYEIKSDRELRYAWEILKQDDEWLKEIHEEAIKETQIEHDKYMKERLKIEQKFTFADVPDIEHIQTAKELKYWKTVEEAKAKQSEARALLALKNDWLSEWSESWAQYDYIKSEYHKELKAIKQPSKAKVKYAKKEYELALKELNNKSSKAKDSID